jgi:hypothetical protein
MLNNEIRRSAPGAETYTGGRGVLVRTPDFLTNSPDLVVPGSMWSNDLAAPSVVYPAKNPWCPTDRDAAGTKCTDGGWKDAVVSAIIGTKRDDMFVYPDKLQHPDWGWGVFYAADSNSTDQRCRYLSSYDAFDCPGHWVEDGTYKVYDVPQKLGAGGYPVGNPDTWPTGGGGGAGCHFDGVLNETNAYDGAGVNTLKDKDCQCNYDLKGNKWKDWLDHLTTYAAGARFPGPTWQMDLAMCWVNNPRDMIDMQNTLYENEAQWNDFTTPNPAGLSTADAERQYWGWNEIPFTKAQIDDTQNWDGVVIKLPAAICPSPDNGGWDRLCCLSGSAQLNIEAQLDAFVNRGEVTLGLENAWNHPGSSVVVAREWKDASSPPHWQTWFFCDDGWTSPTGKYTIKHDKTNDVCYLE